jgi:hypothetical protein
MLFMRLHEYHEYLKPFVLYLNYMPELLVYDDMVVNADSINGDMFIATRLREI